MRHGFLVVDPPDGLGQQNGDVHGLDLVALELLEVVRNGVGDDHLVDGGLLDQAGGLVRENAVGGQGVDLISTALLK